MPIAFDSANELHLTKSTIESALRTIKLADTELYNEIEFLINEIRVFSSGNIRAGSNFNTLGLIYVSQKNPEDEVSRYIEHIVHEATHNLLYAHWTTDPIFTNHSDTLYYTPFRRDSRPLSAIFHAMFVLARTIYIFDRIHTNAPDSLDFGNIRTNYNERGNNASFKTKFTQTSEVISKNAKLTAYGKMIFDGCIQMVKDCKLSI
ncbi:aKG-HExxH-type peptide beta-hydroxylase [Pseudomonas kairouanensis]|uniref:aKG-HExxH-type peptide beta-hydroxylase n=1 Tax=Pseudomonas kairouanensis TaxID=2293832 RepID=UPI00142E9CB4|nr:HEXXH motif-containing putative peptide modification protein [Pseudomonas kairouanensis]